MRHLVWGLAFLVALAACGSTDSSGDPGPETEAAGGAGGSHGEFECGGPLGGHESKGTGGAPGTGGAAGTGEGGAGGEGEGGDSAGGQGTVTGHT